MSLIPGICVRVEWRTDFIKLSSDLHVCTVARVSPPYPSPTHRDSQTHTDIDRHIDTHIHRQTHRHIHTDIDTGIQTHIQAHTGTHTCTHSYTDSSHSHSHSLLTLVTYKSCADNSAAGWLQQHWEEEEAGVENRPGWQRILDRQIQTLKEK